MDIFDKIAAAKSSGGGNYITQGEGTFIVVSNVLSTLTGGDTFIAEFVVKESTSYEGAVDSKTGKPEKANAPGTSCSYVQQLAKFASAAGNVKAYVEALDGSADSVVATLKAITGKENPARGFEIGYSTYQRPIQKGPNAGQLITLVKWHHIELTPEQVAANCKLLDKSADA